MKTEEVPREVKERIEKEAENRVFGSAPSVSKKQRENWIFMLGAESEYLRGQDELAAYKLKVEEARKLTFEKLMEIEENQKEQQEIIDAKDLLLSEMAKALEGNFNTENQWDESIKSVLRKYSKSKEA